ncbi:MAG: serine hydrolase domain-containing protein [Flavobacteriales bacterium]
MKRASILFLIPFLMLTYACRKEELKPSASCSYEKDHSSHPEGEELQQVLEDYVDKGLPGAVVLVRDGFGVWTGAAGKADIKKGTPMSPCHVSKVASITKLMMGTVALQLDEEGKLFLDDRVREYLAPEVTQNIGNARRATLRQLMNHRSGIYDVVSDQGFYLSILDKPDKEWSTEEILDHVRNEDPYFGPGGGERYSNTNFTLLSLVLEKATGKEHQKLLHQRIFEPLNMDQSYYDPHDPLPEHTAKGYYDLYNEGKIVDLTAYSTGNGNGYTGVYSTVQDLKTFIEALYRDKTLLADSTLGRMLNFKGSASDGRKFGLACYKDFLNKGTQEYAYGHRGRDLAYSAGAYYFPEKDITLTLLVNYGTNGDSHLKPTFRDFRSKVADVVLD